MKFFKIFLCSVIIMAVFSMSAFAFSTSTYGDMSSNSTQVQNLLSLAMNYDSFLYSDYVIFQNGQYSWYIVWSDKLEVSSGAVSSEGPVEYISYIRTGSGYDYSYNYTYGTDESFSLSGTHLTVSNVDGLGFKSELYQTFRDSHYTRYFQIFGMAALLVIMFVTLRKGSKA